MSRILGHSRITTTLDVDPHLFDEARHASEIRGLMAQSDFARLLAPARPTANGRRLVAVASADPLD